MDPRASSLPSRPKSGAKTFTFSGKYRALILIGTLFFAGMTVLTLFLPVLEPDDDIWIAVVMCVPVFAGFTLLCILHLRILWNTVIASEEGIGYQKPGKPIDFLRWAEIGEVRARDGLQRLEIFDTSGDRRFKIEYQVENYDDLHRIIRERMAEIRPVAPPVEGAVTFRRWKVIRWVISLGSLVCLGFAASSYADGEPFLAIGFLVFTLFALGTLALDPHSIRILSDRLLLDDHLRQRTVRFQDLIDIRLRHKEVQYGSIAAQIELVRPGRKPIRLQGYEPNIQTVFEHLRAAWEQWILDTGNGLVRD